MKSILEIARRELCTLFYSPIGWLTLFVLAVHSAFILITPVDSILANKAKFGSVLDQLLADEVYLRRFFARYQGITRYIYLYIPLLTMGLFSREYNEGSIKLLFSSPLRIRDIVLGKYLAMLTYGLLIVAIIGILGVVWGLFVFAPFDLQFLLAGMLMLYLLISLYAAIGLFISSLTSYQLAAATGTLAVFFGLNHYASQLVDVSSPDFLQQLVGIWILPEQYITRLPVSQFAALLNSGDLLYFAIMIVTFLGCTALRLQFMRGSKPMSVKVARYGVLAALALVCGYITYQPATMVFFDMTANKNWTPSDEQKQITSQLPRPLKVTKYVNVLENPTDGTALNRFRTYAFDLRNNARAELAIEYVPYYAHTQKLSSWLRKDSVFSNVEEMTRRTSEQVSFFPTDGMDLEELAQEASHKFGWLNFEKILPPHKIQNIIDISREENRDFYLLESGDKKATLQARLSGRIYAPTDQELVAALKRMCVTPPEVGFLIGHGERNPFSDLDRDYKMVFTQFNARYALTNQGFDIDTISLSREFVPSDRSVLVIADPQQPLGQRELLKVNQFIDQGGNVLIVGEPKSRSAVNSVIKSLGVQLSEAQAQSKHSGNSKYAKVLESAVKHSGTAQGILKKRIMRTNSWPPDLVDEKGVGVSIAMPGAIALQYAKNGAWSIYPLVTTPGDTVMLALTRQFGKREQRIIIAGDADFMSNETEGVGFQSAMGTRPANTALVLSLFKWFSYDEFPVDVEREERKERLLVSETLLLKVTLIGLMPLPVLVAGVIGIMRRRKK